MNLFKVIGLIIIVGFFFSCEEKDSILVPEDIAYVSFTKSDASYNESNTTLELELQLVTFSTQRTECTVNITTEGLENPATDTDVTLASNTVIFEKGVGYAKTSLSLIDNDMIDGKKQFYLEITSVPNGIDIGIDGKEKILVTIIDDEHPLRYFNGNYTHVGESHPTWSGTVNWTSQIEVDPDNDSQIIFKNIFPWKQDVQVGVVGVVNEAEKTIELASSQKLTDTGAGYYYFGFYSGENFNDNWEGDQTEDPILGTYTINADKSEIVITLNEWGARWMEPAGTFDGRWWNDYFTTSTLTKTP
ncbi:hypothetical protein L3073_02620 [Ancylomarina sp. DW003]|nr:Calx-beta domain-containing protein [Ancylomarina sp. DW003]MDE5421095.1 hypothetical protein [Ancylomarina sp. DW003]